MKIVRKTIEQVFYVTEKGVEMKLEDMTHRHLLNAYAVASESGLTEEGKVLGEEIMRRMQQDSCEELT